MMNERSPDLRGMASFRSGADSGNRHCFPGILKGQLDL